MSTSESSPAPLFGLLLVGGKSTRMGVDKASLIYQNNVPEWKRLHLLLNGLCQETFLSHRADQDFQEKSIIDPADGPLRAIETAQAAHPHAAWLVLACDMPLVNVETLTFLIQQRDASKNATCYLSPVDQLPEPLCAIYEPAIALPIAEGIKAGHFCPRHYLSDAKHLIAPTPQSLMNANTKAEQKEVQAILSNSQTEKTVTLQYFAQLLDLTSVNTEKLVTSHTTASGVYEELKAKYQFPYKQKDLMLAINDEFSPWETELKENDNIVFIPPVAGG